MLGTIIHFFFTTSFLFSLGIDIDNMFVGTAEELGSSLEVEVIDVVLAVLVAGLRCLNALVPNMVVLSSI